SRRLVGDHILTQFDLMGFNNDFDDAVAIGGWPMDDHPPGGFDRADLPPAVQVRTPIYNIPLRSLYSRNVGNLMMAGRNISASHVAFTSTRVMATCSVIGQAAGTAAALCARHGLRPRQLAEDEGRVRELQRTLLRDDQSIKGRRNDDPEDLARRATVTASGQDPDAPAANVLDGFVRDEPGGAIHRWSTELGPDGAWIELAWDAPQALRRIQITFDTGFQRELTLTSSDGINATIVRAPQPETVRDYRLAYRTEAQGPWATLAEATHNHRRLVRHDVAPVTARALRLHVTATNGDTRARVFEIRCHG
ncbi:MAG TPA: FAD-dependent oxidoreductase, partial [Isosphaeraceae bacterium]